MSESANEGDNEVGVHSASSPDEARNGSRDNDGNDDESLAEVWRRRVQVYWKPLTSVRPINIMRKMRLLTADDAALDEVLTLDSENLCTKACEKFLLYLMNEHGMSHEEITARWSLFDAALKTAHPWLYDIVNGKCEAEDHELQKGLVSFFMDEICADVDPKPLLRHLVTKNLLGVTELETLARITDQKGPTMGAVYMVGHLHRSTNRNWYTDFLSILFDNGYELLVKDLDDGYYQKLLIKTRSRRTPSAEPGGMLSLTVSASGAAHTPRPPAYSAAPSGKSEKDDSMPRPLTDDQKLVSREESLEESQRFFSCPSHTHTDSVANSGDQDATELKLLASSLETNVGMSANIVLKLEADGASENQERRQHAKDIGSKNIHVPEEDLSFNEAMWPDKEPSPSDNSNAEVDSPKEDREEKEDEMATLDLREYQLELAQRALGGENVIICAPTGSGKTHVALKIIDNHLQQRGQGMRKVVFLVNQVALAEQQYKQCAKYLRNFRCKQITGNTGDTEKVPLKHLLVGADILVMTAQILLDALDQKEIDGICQFSLIVFDECHHTNHNHPFNCIMHHYMGAKYNDNADQLLQLPQVVGLTASVGVGKAGRQEQARKHIEKLCAHLDVSYICTVRHNVEQLAQFSNDPKYDQYICSQRVDDNFQKKMEELMKDVEEHVERSNYKRTACRGSKELAALLQPPRMRGTPQYTGWVSQLRKEVAKVRNPEGRRFLESCRRMLEFYNTALIINDECDTEDALRYLSRQIDITNDSIGDNAVEIDTFLKDLFEKNKPNLGIVSKKQGNTNPKLMKLEELLVKAFREEPESRAMVFVKTRDLASALLQWMQRRPELKKLKPGKMVGAGPSVERGGMTKSQQVDVMDYFRDGDHRVMVATSVAEEGLDIRKCNLIIRYNHVTNEIAMVQARGRARAEKSQFVTLAGDNKGVQAKEEINFIREMMMREAIKELQGTMRRRFEDFRRSQEQLQREEKSMRDAELATHQGRQLREGEVEFRCRKCDEYACMSSDIRTIENMHHVVIDLDFRDRHNEKPDPRPQTFGAIQIRGKLSCKACGLDWGRTILFKRTKFPVIKIDGFVLTDEFDRKDAPKKWKQTKFFVKDLDPEELESYRKLAAGVGYTAED